MGKDVLFSGFCRDVKYLTHAFKMCQGLEVEGLRYETGVVRVWFGYDSRSTIQHTVSDQTGATTASQHQKLVDANGIICHNEATAASQCRSCLQPTCLHMAARLRGWRAGWRKGRLKAAWSYSGLSAPKLSSTYLALLGCIGQPDCGDGGRDGAKGA